MQFGVQLPEIERRVGWRELAAMARRVESLGFDSLWYGDHLLYRDGGVSKGPWEAWTTLSALGAVTERVLLGPFVAATAFHAPAMLAKMAATVDEVSGGRLILGIGAGWNRVEFDAYGFPYDHRVSRFEEAFEIVRRLLGGERFSFDGRYHRVHDAELAPPPPPGGPPIMIGSVGPRMLGITLPHVWGWNAWFTDHGNDPDRLRDLVRQVAAAAERAGRDPETLVGSAAVLLQFGGAAGRRNSEHPVTGDPEEMADALGRFSETGVRHIQLVLDPITSESIEQAARVVALVRTGG
jgi:alkanesulfonate monooxygenase SsuD/methylene tetrahydromethanopterin reductase-like flavin-dependent oxidoreductase (luciferase family)